MRSDNLLTPKEWLAQQSTDNSSLYVVMSNTSDANPLKAYYEAREAFVPLPIWEGTPYADWQPVMPYLGRLSLNSTFLDWAAQEKYKDWGWLALSTHEPAAIVEHLKSLTKVFMPDGSEVFFRFWDGRHLIPVIQTLNQQFSTILPCFDQYWVNQFNASITPSTYQIARTYPWWNVPQTVLDALHENDASTLIDNLMQHIQENHPDIYFKFPEINLLQKIKRFVQRQETDMDDTAQLIAQLEKDASL
ncbi:DUF4123 domain-containing protein [Pseudomonas sp. LTJR-52]|uniref:DUF4123 domain-containing protein n=1 Tax=Pseudomonas sp. LTJR-52 TaxID=2479392 RepID=UPI000EFD1D19|nr:DUF4123 domain-containing protein [Pseudomonas sp. LTJR-52]AYN92854.1 DUF4123 domain-containing protein [Pseudomonas sp. LTJR-52]